MTLSQIKDNVAKKYGYDSWNGKLNSMLTHISNEKTIEQRMDEVAILYAQEQIKLLNLHSVSNCVFSITEKQLEKLIEKLHANIGKITKPKGEYGIDLQIKTSTEATIKNFLKKHCC